MLAQLVDIFDSSTWMAMCVAGMGAPFAALMIILLRRQLRTADVATCLIFYWLVGLSFLPIRAGLLTALFTLGLCGLGPVLALILIFCPCERIDRSRGFPVVIDGDASEMKTPNEKGVAQTAEDDRAT